MARRGKGEGSVYKRDSDGLWCTSVELPRSLDGKRRRKVIARASKAEVVSEMRRVQAEVRKYGDVQTHMPTVKEWMAYYLDEIAPDLIRPKTLEDYRRHSDNWIVPQLGKKPLDKVTGDDVHKLTRLIRKTPKKQALRCVPAKELPADTVFLSRSLERAVFNILSGAYKQAIKRRKVFTNPCEQADRPKLVPKEERALTPDEARRLLAHIEGRADAALWATYLLTGARRGEVIGLEVERISGGMIDFSWQIQDLKDVSHAPSDWEHRHLRGNLYLTRPKTSKGWRMVPLLPYLAKLLAEHLHGRTSGLVFTDGLGGPMRPDSVYNAWVALREEAGLPNDVKLHGLRHTLVDLLYDNEVAEPVIMELVGHSSRAVTRGYRTTGNERLKSAAIGAVGQRLGIEK